MSSGSQYLGLVWGTVDVAAQLLGTVVTSGSDPVLNIEADSVDRCLLR
jgi:hypothetical protein